MAEVVASRSPRKVTVGPQTPEAARRHRQGSDVHLLVVATRDRGLAGAFNTNIVRAARRKADELIAAGQDGPVLPRRPQGPRGDPARSIPKQIIAQYDTSDDEDAGFADAQAIADDLVDRYMTDGDSTSCTCSTRTSSRRWCRSRPISRSSRSPLPPKPRPTPAGVAAPRSNMSPTRKRSSPTCCRATSRSRSSARCSRTQAGSGRRR